MIKYIYIYSYLMTTENCTYRVWNWAIFNSELRENYLWNEWLTSWKSINVWLHRILYSIYLTCTQTYIYTFSCKTHENKIYKQRLNLSEERFDRRWTEGHVNLGSKLTPSLVLYYMRCSIPFQSFMELDLLLIWKVKVFTIISTNYSTLINYLPLWI